MRLPMRWMKGYSVIALVCGSLILLTIVAASYVFSSRMQMDATLALKSSRVDRLVLEFVLDLVNAETAQRGYIITHVEDYLEPYDDALVQLKRDSEDLKKWAADLDGGTAIPQLAIDELIAAGERKLDIVKSNLARIKAGTMRPEQLFEASQRGKEAMDEVRRRADAIRELTAQVRNGHAAAMRDAASTLITLISMGAAMIVMLVAGAALVIRRHVHALDEARNELVEINEDLEGRVRERTEMVMRTNEELQRYAYIVSHDLRAPLVNIMGFTSELETDLALLTAHIYKLGGDRSDPAVNDVFVAAEENIPEALTFIRSSMTRMDGLINEILKLSRAGRRVLEPTRLDMTALVSGCVDAIRQKFDAVGAEVRIETDLPTVISDRLALEQIFTNLLDNAAKYLVNDRPGVIRVRGNLDRQFARFEVEDNGRGIAEADRERVFELFRRAGQQDRPGDGIGLAHTRMLARRLGGDVTIKSDGQSGTTFIVTVARDLALRMGKSNYE